MAVAQTLTLSEAGYVLNRSPTTINKAVDKGVIRAKQRRIGNLVQRLLGPAELRFLRLDEELDKDLTPAGRRRLYEAIRKLSVDTHHVTLGELVLDLARIDKDLKARLRRLQSLRTWIATKEGLGEAMIKGTKVPAHLVAALAHSQTIAQILEDFPSLSAAQVEAAIDYAKAYPKRGRPYPKQSLKRALADLAEMGAFDKLADSSQVTPRIIP